MKVLILAAGRGERLRPLTDHTPKPLLEAGGRPLIEHTLLALSEQGFRDCVINLAYRGAQIREHLGDGSHLGVGIRYSLEGDEALETGGGIHHALPLLGSEPFLVVNGDIACDYPYARLRSVNLALAHLVLTANPSHHPNGDFALHDGLLHGEGEPRHTYTGIGVFRPELFAHCTPGKFPLAPLLRAAMPAGKIGGELYPGFWMDIGTLQRLREFDARLKRPREQPEDSPFEVG
jgi:MurNAc alpha-1-phosphate uridylyltransferase